eukprot:g6929.t2
MAEAAEFVSPAGAMAIHGRSTKKKTHRRRYNADDTDAANTPADLVTITAKTQACRRRAINGGGRSSRGSTKKICNTRNGMHQQQEERPSSAKDPMDKHALRRASQDCIVSGEPPVPRPAFHFHEVGSCDQRTPQAFWGTNGEDGVERTPRALVRAGAQKRKIDHLPASSKGTVPSLASAPGVSTLPAPCLPSRSASTKRPAGPEKREKQSPPTAPAAVVSQAAAVRRFARLLDTNGPTNGGGSSAPAPTVTATGRLARNARSVFARLAGTEAAGADTTLRKQPRTATPTPRAPRASRRGASSRRRAGQRAPAASTYPKQSSRVDTATDKYQVEDIPEKGSVGDYVNTVDLGDFYQQVLTAYEPPTGQEGLNVDPEVFALQFKGVTREEVFRVLARHGGNMEMAKIVLKRKSDQWYGPVPTAGVDATAPMGAAGVSSAAGPGIGEGGVSPAWPKLPLSEGDIRSRLEAANKTARARALVDAAAGAAAKAAVAAAKAAAAAVQATAVEAAKTATARSPEGAAGQVAAPATASNSARGVGEAAGVEWNADSAAMETPTCEAGQAAAKADAASETAARAKGAPATVNAAAEADTTATPEPTTVVKAGAKADAESTSPANSKAVAREKAAAARKKEAAKAEAASKATARAEAAAAMLKAAKVEDPEASELLQRHWAVVESTAASEFEKELERVREELETRVGPPDRQVEGELSLGRGKSDMSITGLPSRPWSALEGEEFTRAMFEAHNALLEELKRRKGVNPRLLFSTVAKTLGGSRTVSEIQDRYYRVWKRSDAYPKFKKMRRRMKEVCDVCGEAGLLLICDGCESFFDLECVNLPDFPATDWFCAECASKKPSAPVSPALAVAPNSLEAYQAKGDLDNAPSGAITCAEAGEHHVEH